MEVIQSAVFKARAALAAAASTVASLKAKREALVATAAAAAEVRSRERELVITALIEEIPATPLPDPVVGEAEFAFALKRINAQLSEAVEAEAICKAQLRGAIADVAIERRAAAVTVYREALERLRLSLVDLWALDRVCGTVASPAIGANLLTHFDMRDCTRGGERAYSVTTLRRDAEPRAAALRAEIAAACGEQSLPF